jgi:ABC-type glycerol-3-phosphate transport system substrate-binding protein
MKRITTAVLGAFTLALAACGGDGDDKLGQQAQDVAENKADMLDEAADNASGAQEDALEAQAEVTRETGDDKEEAIDDADVNAQAMSNEQKNAMVNGM